MNVKSEYMKNYHTVHKEKISERQKRYYQENKEKLNARQKEYNRKNKELVNSNNRKKSRKTSTRYSAAKSGAKKRQILFSLTLNEYQELILPTCYYCQGFFGEVVTGIGLDRLDNAVGYVYDNCVSCCRTCNSIKNEFLSADETKAVISLIIQMRTKENEGNNG